MLQTPSSVGGQVSIPFPTTVLIDEGSDGIPDLRLRYQYDGRGNVLARETDTGVDGLVDQRVLVRRDDNGAIVHVTQQDLFPIARNDDQSFTYNPYGYLTAADDLDKKRTFPDNRSSRSRSQRAARRSPSEHCPSHATLLAPWSRRATRGSA